MSNVVSATACSSVSVAKHITDENLSIKLKWLDSPLYCCVPIFVFGRLSCVRAGYPGTWLFDWSCLEIPPADADSCWLLLLWHNSRREIYDNTTASSPSEVSNYHTGPTVSFLAPTMRIFVTTTTTVQATIRLQHKAEGRRIPSRTSMILPPPSFWYTGYLVQTWVSSLTFRFCRAGREWHGWNEELLGGGDKRVKEFNKSCAVRHWRRKLS